MNYGYPRVSTPKQNIDRQIRNIREVCPDAILYPEYYTGTTSDRKQWQKLMNKVQPGDTIYIDSVSRMSRDAESGFADYERLFQLGVDLIFLKEPHINTSVFRETLKQAIPMTGSDVDVILEGINRYLMILAKKQIILAFEQAEKEVTDLHQRTKEGIETARRNGKQPGRPGGKHYETKKAQAAKEQIRKHAIEFGGTLTDTELIQLTGVQRNTYYKYKREIKEEL